MNSGTPDFDALVEKAKTGQREHIENLYREFLQLKEWIYITSLRPDLENVTPFIGIVDEKPWFFIFTDSEKAKAYCDLVPGFAKEDGSIFTIKVNVSGSIKMLLDASTKGVFGIRVNEGDHGWFSPIQNLPAIAKHLNINVE